MFSPCEDSHYEISVIRIFTMKCFARGPNVKRLVRIIPNKNNVLESFKPVIFCLLFPTYEHHDQYVLVYHQALNIIELITYILVIDAIILKFIFGIKLYIFRTASLPIIRSFSLYTQQWYMSYKFADSLRAGS